MDKKILKEYNRLARIYDRKWAHYLQNTLEKAIAYCLLSGEEEILDVACGTGELEKRLLASYPKIHITACDISPEMLKVAKEKLAGNDHVSFIECPADRIPIADASKDLIICCNALHFFKEPEKILEEWQRILRRSGKVFILDWCRDFFFCKVMLHHHIYTLRELSALLLAHNFNISESRRFKISWFWGVMVISGQK